MSVPNVFLLITVYPNISCTLVSVKMENANIVDTDQTALHRQSDQAYPVCYSTNYLTKRLYKFKQFVCRYVFPKKAGIKCMTFIVFYIQYLYHPTKHTTFRHIFRQSITKTRLFKYIENFTPKNSKFSDKNSNVFQISAQNIDCGYSLEPPRRGGSNEYPQSMFLNSNKKNNVYPCKPQFYCIKVGFKGVNII